MAKNPILFNARGDVITPRMKQAMGLYPSVYSYQNVGKFRYVNTPIADTENTLNQYSRLELVKLSRTLFAQMPCLDAASDQKAEWTVGDCFDPVYEGKQKEWGKLACDYLLNQWYPQANIKGFAFDFKTTLKGISTTLDRDGDILMLVLQTRNGVKIQLVATHRIKNRNFSDTVTGGRYDGYPIQDGVIYNTVGTPIAYTILGDTADDDYIASVLSAYLIFNPKHLDKGRGVPPIASAILTGLSIQEIDDYLQTTIKLESMVHLKEFNETGEMPANRINSVANFDEDTCITTTPRKPPTVEVMQGGIRYIKYGQGDLKSFESHRPATETQEFIKRLETHLLSALGWPHQVLYSPESVGGAAARGISEVVRRTISSRQSTLEKFANIAIVAAVARAIEDGILPENNAEPYWQLFGFTKPAQFTLDSGYERAADLNDYRIGAKTLDELTSKYGKRLSVIREQRKQEVIDLYNDIEAIHQQYPDMTKEQIHNDMQMMTPNAIPIPADVTDQPTKI